MRNRVIFISDKNTAPFFCAKDDPHLSSELIVYNYLDMEFDLNDLATPLTKAFVGLQFVNADGNVIKDIVDQFKMMIFRQHIFPLGYNN